MQRKELENMTESEAKWFMLIEKECINRDCDRNCATCDLVQSVEDLNSAYSVAIQALEKQIPKKTALITRAGAVIKFYPCPTCSTSDKYIPVYPKQKYCVNCGQRLDWSDE